jgi:osmotically-inducible protein OsmY
VHLPEVGKEITMVQTDEQIKTDIVNRLNWDSRVDASDVLVEVEDGVATLAGSVPTYGARRAASDAALCTSGLTSLNNRLKVVYPPGSPVPLDGTIRANARNVLTWYPAIDENKIEVTVNDGLVKLEGTVPHYWQKDKAEELVSDLSGVLVIENEIDIVPTKRISDELIAGQIRDELERSLITPSDVEVKVANGIVTLTGTVLGYAEQQSAYNAAARTAGVKNIVNKTNIIFK